MGNMVEHPSRSQVNPAVSPCICKDGDTKNLFSYTSLHLGAGRNGPVAQAAHLLVFDTGAVTFDCITFRFLLLSTWQFPSGRLIIFQLK